MSGFLPDTPEVRSDILDYYDAVGQFDYQLTELMEALDKSGLAQNTMVVVTSDNGMPSARARGEDDRWDRCPYTGPRKQPRQSGRGQLSAPRFL